MVSSVASRNMVVFSRRMVKKTSYKKDTPPINEGGLGIPTLTIVLGGSCRDEEPTTKGTLVPSAAKERELEKETGQL